VFEELCFLLPKYEHFLIEDMLIFGELFLIIQCAKCYFMQNYQLSIHKLMTDPLTAIYLGNVNFWPTLYIASEWSI